MGPTLPRAIGRYWAHAKIASGGMASVYLGRLVADAGFARTVAIKAMLAQHGDNDDFHKMFVDEARLVARIRHPNVVPTLDVVADDGELFIVMEYVHGETLSRLLRTCARADIAAPLPVVCAIVRDALLGLHAAHEATSELGEPLNVVHRDVSPQNILVGADGIARVLDFGVAKAAGRLQVTREGQIKGKLAYMAPEQLRGDATRATDIFAASIILWEAIVGRHLFAAANEAMMVDAILHLSPIQPSEIREGVPTALDKVVMRGLARSASDRFATAREMATELARACPPADSSEVSDWVRSLAGSSLDAKAAAIREMETAPRSVGSPTERAPSSVAPRSASSPSGPSISPASSPLGPSIGAASSPSGPSISAASSPSGPAVGATTNPTTGPAAYPEMNVAPAAGPAMNVAPIPTAPPRDAQSIGAGFAHDVTHRSPSLPRWAPVAAFVLLAAGAALALAVTNSGAKPPLTAEPSAPPASAAPANGPSPTAAPTALPTEPSVSAAMPSASASPATKKPAAPTKKSPPRRPAGPSAPQQPPDHI